MCEPKHRFQSNAKIDREGGYIAGQSFNFFNLKHYWEGQVQSFLSEFDRTPERIRQNQLNYYKERLNYLKFFASNINSITLNILRDQITLLELTFENTVWYQSNKKIDESQITYYTDSESEDEA